MSVKSKIRGNCVFCMFWPTLFFDLMLINRCRCQHKTDPPKLTTSVSLVRVSVAIILATGQIWKMADCQQSEMNVASNDQIILMLNEIIFSVMLIVGAMGGALISNRRFTIFYKYQHLLNSWQAFGTNKLISQYAAQKLRRRGQFYTCMNMLVLVAYSYILVRAESHHARNFGYFFVAVEALLTFSQLTYNAQIVMEAKFFTALMEKLFRNVRDSLANDRLVKTVDLFDDSTSRRNRVNLRVEIKTQIAFYRVIVEYFYYLNRFYNPLFLYWFTMMIVMSIFNLYVFIVKIIQDGYVSVDILVYLSKILACSAAAGHTTTEYQLLANYGEEIKSFLFRYPISQLKSGEATQVEVMIAALQVRKPILSASDIFTVGTKLLTCLSGAVVTYVLVALQFHASWVKE